MEAKNTSIQCDSNNEKALKGLFEAFGSMFSLQDITYAYHKADEKADLAGEILFEMQESGSTSSKVASNSQPIYVKPSTSSNGNGFDKSRHPNGKVRAPKQKWRPISGGTVSSIIGKDYVKPMPIANGCVTTKPTKLDTKELPASVLWGEETGLNLSKNGQIQKDTEDFLITMLGDGFQLEKHAIQQILDNCGYDMQKSMEELFALPAVNMDEEDGILSQSTKKTLEEHSNSQHPSLQKSLPLMSSSGGTNGISNLNGDGVLQREKRNDLQKEVLVALFNAADESEVSRRIETPRTVVSRRREKPGPEVSRRRERRMMRSSVLGTLVVEPPRDIALEQKSASVVFKQDNNDDEDEDEDDAYQKLRSAVKEYRATMKEYYKAAVTAFAEGDHDRANKLMDKGRFFHERAKKADSESREKIFETKIVDTEDEIILDLHEHSAKEAIYLLKSHLSSLSGIATIKYLKVIIETDEEDTSKGARRRLVIKRLEKESIKWSEGGNAGTILIRLDNINRKALSFAKV